MKKISIPDLLGITSLYLQGDRVLDAGINTFFKRQFKGDFIVLNNGSAAMQALIDDFELKNSEIILPSFICSDVFTNLFIQNNITPIILDCAPGSLNISLTQAKKAITKKTKALIIVHVLGMPCWPEEARALCDKHKILLIEDCAHSINTRHKNSFLGDYGDAAIFSFAKEMPNFAGGLYLNNKRQIKPQIKNSIKQFKWSERDFAILFHKFNLSKFIKKSQAPPIQEEQTHRLEKINLQNAPKLSKAIFCYYSSRLNLESKRKLAYMLYNELALKGIPSIISKNDIEGFSAKSFPILSKKRSYLLNSLAKLGLSPGIGWTPTFSQNSLAKKRWNLKQTPIAEQYSRELLTISLDEVNNKNLSLISRVISKE